MSNVFVPATVTTRAQVFVFTDSCIEMRTNGKHSYACLSQEVMDSFDELRFFADPIRVGTKIVDGVKQPRYLLHLESTEKFVRNPTVMYLQEGDAVAIDSTNPNEPLRQIPRDAVITPE